MEIDQERLQRMARDLRIQFDAGQEPEHLSPDELMAMADRSSPNHPHLQECEICRAELDELLAFKASMRRRRPWLPYAVAAAIAGMAVTIGLVVPWRDRDPHTPATPPHQAVVKPQPPPPVATGERPPEWDAWVGDVRARRTLPMPAVITELQSRKTHLRGAEDEDDLRLSPDQTVVADTQPRFQWSGRPGATYRVILRTADGIVESGDLTVPRWTPPANLKRGAEYQWQVELTANHTQTLYPKAPDPPARFRVLPLSALDEIDEARRRYPDDDLLQAVLLARHGLRVETIVALDRLERTDPALAADLRDSLRRWPH